MRLSKTLTKLVRKQEMLLTKLLLN